MSVRESMDRHLSPAEAKRFYDRLGSRQDWQGFFSDLVVFWGLLVSRWMIPVSHRR